ncbi:MAG: N-acetylmuramoyl-L-alanine amidase [Lachnospiraceae bacterium]|nr:N-acetylmuramoyl-L-alanine amidase [Lachnospiraceae bacterium]
MVVGVNCGHTIMGAGCGADGIINESVYTRKVGYALMEILKNNGVTVIDCTVDKASSQSEYLKAVIDFANNKGLDWFISIHFNASTGHMANGVEAYTYKGRKYQDALDICENISRFGFQNRGVKDGSGLYVVRKTKAKAILIEICFCDNNDDVRKYHEAGGEAVIAEAIYSGIQNKVENDRIPFDEYIGSIARQDWKQRRILLPSVVVAQAIKESGWGTSELARNAKALFGIKQNGWKGKTYMKTATEQKSDGSIYKVENTIWRAYENWEQSVIDHNDYIATRSTDGGKTLRYAEIIGCTDYKRVCAGLQRCGYATAINYGESLIRDYIEKYYLARFDEYPN